MATNEILPFCPTDNGLNLLTQVNYAAATDRTIGNQPGIASSQLNNKALRQAAFIASQFAQYVADTTGVSVLDDGNTAALLTNIATALTTTYPTKIKTANYTVLPTDGLILCSTNPITLSLYDVTTAPNKRITINKTDSSFTNLVTINPFSGQTVNGLSTYVLYTLNESVTLQSDATGLNWSVVDHKTITQWVNAGANVISAVTTAPVQTGNTKTVDKVWWRRVGGDAQIRIEFDQTAAGTNTAGSGNYLWTLPSGLVIDTTLLTAFGGASVSGATVIKSTNSVGASSFGTTTAGFQFAGGVFVYDTTHVRIGGAGAGTNGTDSQIDIVGSAAITLTNASITVNATYSVPILNWQP